MMVLALIDLFIIFTCNTTACETGSFPKTGYQNFSNVSNTCHVRYLPIARIQIKDVTVLQLTKWDWACPDV